MGMQGAINETKVEELKTDLAAAKMDADALRAEMSGVQKQTRALEKHLRSARSGASLQDIQAVTGGDKKLVRKYTSTVSVLIPTVLLS